MSLWRFLVCALLAFIVASGLALTASNASCDSSQNKGSKEVREWAEKQALKKALQKVGASIAGDLSGESDQVLRKGSELVGKAAAGATYYAIDALTAYFTHPDDTRLDAAMYKLTLGATKIVFPQYGLALTGGRWLFGYKDNPYSEYHPGAAGKSLEYVAKAARSGQFDAFICGDPSFDNLFSKASFFDLNALRNQGITCENFAQRIQNEQQLQQMKALWDGYYTRQLKNDVCLGDRECIASAEAMLREGWNRLEQRWKLIWAEKIWAEFRAEMRRQALELAVQEKRRRCVDTAAAAPSPKPPAIPAQQAAAEATEYTFEVEGHKVTVRIKDQYQKPSAEQAALHLQSGETFGGSVTVNGRLRGGEAIYVMHPIPHNVLLASPNGGSFTGITQPKGFGAATSAMAYLCKSLPNDCRAQADINIYWIP